MVYGSVCGSGIVIGLGIYGSGFLSGLSLGGVLGTLGFDIEIIRKPNIKIMKVVGNSSQYAYSVN